MVPELMIWIRSGIASELTIAALLFGEADTVRIAAIANSPRLLVFWNLRMFTRGGMAPHVTISSLFLKLIETKSLDGM